MHLMFYCIMGLAFGDVVAYINSLITRRVLRSESAAVLLGAGFLRILVDAAALGSVFVLCRRFGIDQVPVLTATAVGLSVMGVFLLVRMTAPMRKPAETPSQTGEEETSD